MSEIKKEADPTQEEVITKEDAYMRIMSTRQNVYMRGANDVEWERIDNILKELDEEKITPKEAVEQAEAIEGGKQDYH